MLHAQPERFSFSDIEDGDVLAFDFYVRSAEMQQRGHESETTRIYEVPIMVQDVDVGAEVEAFLSRDNTQGLRFQRSRTTDGLLKEARKQDLALVLPGIISLCTPSNPHDINRNMTLTHLPTSKAGLASGLNSVLIVNTPSNFRSGYGATTSHEILAMTLVLPMRASATPYSSPNVRVMGRDWSKARLSRRRFSRKAERRKVRSLVEGSSSRGMAGVWLSHFWWLEMFQWMFGGYIWGLAVGEIPANF